MPEIGRPRQRNPFNKIKMAPPKNRGVRAVTENVGTALNKLSGNEQNQRGVKFVDRSQHNQMGKNEFLKLLAHQLTNQDPLNPMDQRKFSGEMAQFSQLEQLTNMNSKFDKLGVNDKTEQKSLGANFLGKEVMTSGTSINHDGQKKQIEIPFFLPKRGVKTLVRIFDKKGQMIKQLEQENLRKGMNYLSWDGVRADGIVAQKGSYNVRVMGWDGINTPFKGQTKSKGLVTAVSFEDGNTILKLDGNKTVFLRDVETFGLPRHNEKQEEGVNKNPQVAQPVAKAEKERVTSIYDEMANE
jgi:flagellar basal-body rod modification protein FlgD